MEQLYQFIKASYNNDKSITIYATNSEKTHKIKVVGFEPYFYVRQDDSVPDDEDIEQVEEGFVHEDGFPVKKIIVSSPNVVHSRFKSLRDQFTQHYEADIPFIRRFLIDTGITSGFRIKGSRNDIVSYQDLIPETFTVTPKICYIDFEENVTTRFVNPDKPINEVTAWTAFCTPENHYITCVLNPTLNEEKIIEQWSSDHTVIHVKEEKTLLQLFDSYLKSKQPHALAYWHGEVADYKYPEARGKKIGVNVDFEPYDRIDLCQGYEIRFNRLYYRLKDVAIDEGIFDPSELVAEEFHKDFWQDYVQNFIPGNTEHNKTLKFPLYSKMDVQILVILDLLGWEHYDEIKEKIKEEPPRKICVDILNLKAFIGLEDAQATFYNSVSIDTFTLRKAHKKHIVLNSSSRGEGQSYHGAKPFCPPEGIYYNIKTLDASRYYPNIILGYNIDGLMCEIVIELNTLRDEYEAKIEQLKSDGYDTDSPQITSMEKRRDNVKFLLNSTYGYLGSPRSRKYKREKADKITAKARLGLNVIKTAMEMRNVPVLYGHTDSIFIQCKDEEIEELLTYLNNVVLANHCKEERIPQLLRLKLEKICPKGLFVDAKGTKGVGAKARYALLVKFEKGKETDYVDIVGFDYIRGNTSPVARKVQMNIITAILRGNEQTIPAFIQKIVKDVKDGKYTFEKIATPITIRKPLHQYNTNIHHIKATYWSIQNLGLEIIAGDRIKLLPVKRVVGKQPTNVIAFFDEENLKGLNFIPDYDKVIEKTIYSKIEQFLNLIHITRRDIEGHYDPEVDWF